MTIVDRQVDTESIPKALVPIAKMMTDTGWLVLCETYVVQAIASVQGIDSVTPPRVLLDRILIQLEDVA